MPTLHRDGRMSYFPPSPRVHPHPKTSAINAFAHAIAPWPTCFDPEKLCEVRVLAIPPLPSGPKLPPSEDSTRAPESPLPKDACRRGSNHDRIRSTLHPSQDLQHVFVCDISRHPAHLANEGRTIHPCGPALGEAAIVFGHGPGGIRRRHRWALVVRKKKPATVNAGRHQQHSQCTHNENSDTEEQTFH